MKVLGESYTPDDDEDMAFATVSSVWIPRGRSRTEVMMARAGNWVLLGGVDADIVKTATIVGAGESNYGGDDGDGEIYIFSPLKYPQVRLGVTVGSHICTSSSCHLHTCHFFSHSSFVFRCCLVGWW